MPILTALLFAISTNLDCLAFGLSYGIRNISIDKKSNIIIAFIASLGTYFSMLLGDQITKYISLQIAENIGFIILFTLSLWILFEPFSKKRKKIKNYDKDNSGEIDMKESLLLALTLSLNNIGVGIGASISGLNIFYTSFFTLLFSLFFIQISQNISKKYLSKNIQTFASLCSGFIILILAIYEFFI